MLTESMKKMVETVHHAFVASSGADGMPHLAAAEAVSVPDLQRLRFEAWFCPTTLRNVSVNPIVAVAVADPASGQGFQFVGRVETVEETAMMDGFLPDEPPGMPQVETRMTVLVECVMEFTAGAHTDQPLG
ncbi:pyridoxamine 5'-phosphate oxidase family protein [Geomesophilobacter sediminis]|uniref:Pyridoxamine 5'-phosphate oxidase family protein n=1 Tax=Geomesophilobacter sediminis TaxID=2798584 RepID=A0A8J7IWR0_9BACT|nr:pyridoxamine 5'-phosphate oxidase family protein [Geomesophilobacter sediminis]MBJ6724037.1 pyridoxamine 5'-phosphate oxidase family protein [Geomesophilobacter sediminis]